MLWILRVVAWDLTPKIMESWRRQGIAISLKPPNDLLSDVRDGNVLPSSIYFQSAMVLSCIVFEDTHLGHLHRESVRSFSPNSKAT